MSQKNAETHQDSKLSTQKNHLRADSFCIDEHFFPYLKRFILIFVWSYAVVLNLNPKKYSGVTLFSKLDVYFSKLLLGVPS